MVDGSPVSPYQYLPGWLFVIFVLVCALLLLVVFVLPVVLGVRAAKAKGRSPHWMWFGLNPVLGWIAFLCLRYVASPVGGKHLRDGVETPLDQAERRSPAGNASEPLVSQPVKRKPALDPPVRSEPADWRRAVGNNKAIDLILECIDPATIWAVDLKPAIEHLQHEGPQGANLLASLVRELTRCRSEKVIVALDVAKELPQTEALRGVLFEVAAATPVKLGSEGAFAPEIVGGGRIGWTDATHAKAVALARAALDRDHAKADDS